MLVSGLHLVLKAEKAVAYCKDLKSHSHRVNHLALELKKTPAGRCETQKTLIANFFLHTFLTFTDHYSHIASYQLGFLVRNMQLIQCPWVHFFF